MSLLGALTVAAVPTVIVFLHIPAVGIKLLTDTVRLQMRIGSSYYCSSMWWDDEVITCNSRVIKGDFRALEQFIKEHGT